MLKRGLGSVATFVDTKTAVLTRNWPSSAAERFAAGDGAVVPALEFEAAPGLKFLDLAQRIAESGADSVIVAASATDSAVLDQQLRRTCTSRCQRGPASKSCRLRRASAEQRVGAEVFRPL